MCATASQQSQAAARISVLDVPGLARRGRCSQVRSDRTASAGSISTTRRHGPTGSWRPGAPEDQGEFAMTTIYAATEDSLVCLSDANGGWEARRQLQGRAPRCIAVDPRRPERVWCGTAGAGIWRSVDSGATWQAAGSELAAAHVSAVAVSPDERVGEDGVVYAGTDPSALFRSEDGGATWNELAAMRALPSAPPRTFPPRPETSHVRW